MRGMIGLRLATTSLLVAATTASAATGAIAVTVRDAATGLLLPGAELRLSGPDQPAKRSNDRGFFRFETVPAGTHRLAVSHSGYVPIRFGPADVPIEVREGAQTTIERLLQPVASIEGRLLTADGGPIPGASITAVTNDDSKTTSGNDGSFRLMGLPSGSQSLSVQLPENFRRAAARTTTGETRGLPASLFYPEDSKSAEPLTLAMGQRLSGLEIRVASVPLVAFSGTVIDGATGQPPAHGQLEFNGSTLSLATDGRFHFDLLAPGEYYLLAYRSAADRALPASAKLTIGPTGLVGYKIILSADTGVGRVEGRFRAAPQQGAAVSLITRGRNGRVEGALQTDGSFFFDSVPVGEWTPTAWGGGAERRSCSARVSQAGRRIGRIQVAAGVNQPLEVECAYHVKITGTVVDAAGRPLPEAVLFLTGGTSILSYGGKVDGTFETSAPPGDYTISAWPKSYRYRMNAMQGCGNARKMSFRADVADMRLVVCP